MENDAANHSTQAAGRTGHSRLGLFGLIRWLFHVLWTGANGLRKFLHMILLFFLFAAFFGALSDTPKVLPSEAALVIRPEGSIVEQLEGSAYDRAVAGLLGEARPQTLMSDILEALELAETDKRIDAVVLDLGAMGGTGLSKLKRIGDAIDEFELSGKPVLATSDYYSQGSYYLAARASEVYLHNDGFLFLNGLAAYRNYYKTAIDKLLIDWNVFRAGTHKSAVEPFTRTDMSPEDRSSMEHLLGELWKLYRDDIQSARELDSDAVAEIADNLVELVANSEGPLGSIYVNAGLVDGLVSRQEFQEKVLAYVAEDPEREGYFQAVGMNEFLAEHNLLHGDKSKDENVAIIVAAGTIMNGSQPPGSIGSDSTAELLRRAREDESVKAVVLRVDSPGGSVFASRIIGNEIDALKASGKPVVASMSSIAASGGYWISMTADRIFASPATITGSIGVFGMFPTFERTLDAVGITTDGTGTTRWAGEMRPDRTMAPYTRELFQHLIDKDYDDFITRVAEGRKMDKSAVDEIAQGQVWTGEDARDNGLIDEFGELEDAVAAAAELAGIDDYGTVLIEKELSAAEQLAVEFLGTVAARKMLGEALSRPRSAIDELAGLVEQALAPIAKFNDPRGSYAHCFCAME